MGDVVLPLQLYPGPGCHQRWYTKGAARALQGHCTDIARVSQGQRGPHICWPEEQLRSLATPLAVFTPPLDGKGSFVAGRSGVEEGRGMQARVSASPREAAEQSMTQPLRHLGRGHVILISFFVLNRKGVCG